MASSYPGGLDSLATNKADATVTATDHPGHHNDLADAVNKIEAELGTTPSGANATVKERLEIVEGNRIYVAAPTGVGATDSANIAAAIAAAPASGATIVFQRGDYVCSSAWPDLSGLRGLIFEGATVPEITGDGTGTVITFTPGTGASMIIAKDGAEAMIFRQLYITYNNASYSGHLIDLRNTTGSGANDTHDITFEHCFIGSGSLTNAASLVRMAQSHSMLFDHCAFKGADTGVYGREANEPTGYCNQVNFRSCRFINNITTHIKNGGEAWVFDGCTFEPRVDGRPGAWTYDSTLESSGVTFIGCWFGDVSVAGNPWIKWNGDGLHVSGCMIGVEAVVNSAILIGANGCRGITVRGNRCKGVAGGALMDFNGTTGHTGVDVSANAVDSVTEVVGAVASFSTIGRGVRIPARAASVGNVTISGPGATIDGVTMVAGDRVLLKDQTTAGQNGLYTWTGSASAMTRTEDADTAAEFSDSLLISVDEGTMNADTVWSLSTPKPITLGTTALRFGRLMPGYNFASRDPWSHGGNAIAATMDRNDVTNLIAQTAITAITSFHGGMVVPAGRLITNINAFCTAAGAGAVTLFWWALVRQSDRVVLQRTANSTTLPTVDAVHTRALQATLTLDYDTPCYIALATQVATTSPSFAGVTGLATSNFSTPILTGNSSTTPTSTPPTVGAVLGAPAAGNTGRIHAWLS